MLVKYLRLPIEVLRASPKAPYDNKITTQQVAFWIGEMTKQKLLSRAARPGKPDRAVRAQLRFAMRNYWRRYTLRYQP